MAKADKITVDVEIAISDETVCRCMRVLEMWMDDNPDKNIVCDLVPCTDRVRHRFRIERLKQDAE